MSFMCHLCVFFVNIIEPVPCAQYFSSMYFQISEIINRFERKGYKLVAIKVVIPTKEFAQQHYHDLKERPFFNGLCDFLSSGPVVAMVRTQDTYEMTIMLIFFY